jgi:copper homeostasis protein
MLRLTDGFSAGGATGIEKLCERAAALRTAGAEEFVLGFLDDAGQADLYAVDAVTAAVPGCRWTFHRALDHAADRESLRKQLADAPGLDTCLTAGSPNGVADGYRTLLTEAARTTANEPGYTPRLLVGGGLTLEHVPGLRRAGIDAFHIGTAARPGGWTAPIDPTAVRTWRELLDEEEQGS